MLIAAAVILFYPDKKTVDNLISYSSFINTLYAIDNSENSNTEIIALIKEIPNCRYIYDGENKGIAKQLNQACKLAVEDGFEWLLTMDQDSFFEEKNISTYIACLKLLDNKGQIAMAGVTSMKTANEEINCKSTEVTSLITSGSTLNLSLFDEIGRFNEALFIDYVDYEYCYRAILKGFKIIQFKNIFFHHSLGISSTHRSLKNFKTTFRSLHSPLRLYYMTRNYLYMRSQYSKTFPAEISMAQKDLLIRLKNNLLYGKERMKVIKFFLKGIIDFKRKRMGKLS